MFKKLLNPKKRSKIHKKTKKFKFQKFMWRGLGQSIFVPKIKFLTFTDRSSSTIFNFCSFVSENDYFLIFWETHKSNMYTSKTKVVARCLNLLILFYPVQRCWYLAEKWSKTFSRVAANTDIIYSIAKFCCYGFS